MNFTSHLSKRQLIELDACTRCGECVKWCPVTEASQNYANTPMDKITTYRSFIQAVHGLKARLFKPRIDEEELRTFAEEVYKCTTCGRCGVVCPVGIHCQELWPSIRAHMLEMGYGPVDKIKAAIAVLESKHNPFDLPYETRNDWIPKDIKIAEKAKLAFFVGCELAYRAQPMAVGAVRILNAAGIPFTIFEDEWCCGFPLYVLGDRGREFREEIEHNIQGWVSRGVKTVVPSCPCCMNVMKLIWPKYYGRLPFEVVHVLEAVAESIRNGRLKFSKSFKGKVTYHDPCYLSRGWGKGQEVVEQPREIIRSIPGAELVEMKYSRRLSRCPGSGGGMRRTNPELSEEMAVPLIKEAEATGASILLTSCPAVYERLHLVAEKKYKTDLKIMDILDFASNFV